MRELNIVMSSDDNFAPYLGITILSIIKNKMDGYKIIFNILDGEVSKSNKEKIKNIIKNNEECDVNFIKIDKKKFNAFPEKGHIKIPSYYRIIAPEIIPTSRLLYLDSDIIVTGDLMQLYSIDLKNNVIAAVKDVSEQYAKKQYFRKISRYFNAGVLLIDSQKWRQHKIWEKTLAIIKKENIMRKNKYADQDILNDILENNWLKINQKYNEQINEYESEIKKNAVILHFIGRIKPWHSIYNNKNKKYYLQYLNLSPWDKQNIFINNYKYKKKLAHNFRIYIPRYMPRILLRHLIILKKIVQNFNQSLNLKKIFFK
jgi:lipopolysaccharide biosynthesis glycosyltransferase